MCLPPWIGVVPVASYSVYSPEEPSLFSLSPTCVSLVSVVEPLRRLSGCCDPLQQRQLRLQIRRTRTTRCFFARVMGNIEDKDNAMSGETTQIARTWGLGGISYDPIRSHARLGRSSRHSEHHWCTRRPFVPPQLWFSQGILYFYVDG